jgi:hypothetical protein
MHLPTLLLGASLASSYALQQFGPGPEQMNYLEHINGGQNEDQNQGQDYGQSEGQHEGQNYNQKASQNGKYNGNIDGNYDNYDNNYDDDDDIETYNSLYNDAPSAQSGSVSTPIHSTFVVRPSPAVVPHATASSSHAQSPASGYAYNYPSPAASKPVINSNAPVASSALPAYQAPAPDADSNQAPASQDHQAPAQAPQAPPQPKPTQAPAQEPAPAPAPETSESEPVSHSPVDNSYGPLPDSSEDLPTGLDSLPDSAPSGQSDVAPVDPLQPGDNVAPVLFNQPHHYGQDEGNAFCMGTCHPNPELLKCEKPYVSNRDILGVSGLNTNAVRF